MIKVTTYLSDLKLIEPKVFIDNRGYFMESYNRKDWNEADIPTNWVQDNEAKSNFGVLRGLHYQTGKYAQGKLVRVITGSVYDVAVDLRTDSPTFTKSYGVKLSGENKKQLYIPKGFAHGYLVLSEEAIFAYKCNNFYNPDAESGVAYDDPEFNIEWPMDKKNYILSNKDEQWPAFKNHKPINVSHG